MSYCDTFERYELKFLIDRSLKNAFMEEFLKHMQLDEYGHTTIQNIYYDTPDYKLIRRSLEKPAYKEKIRLRSYGIAAKDTTVFIELKKKYKGVVYKRRTASAEEDAVGYLNRNVKLPGEEDQIRREIDYFKNFYEGLRPAMVISYEREAFFEKSNPQQRMTIDENILWRDEDFSLRKGAYGTSILKNGECLLEVKVASAMPIWLVSLLSELQIYRVSFSKYGRAYEMMTEEEFLPKERRA